MIERGLYEGPGAVFVRVTDVGSSGVTYQYVTACDELLSVSYTQTIDAFTAHVWRWRGLPCST